MTTIALLAIAAAAAVVATAGLHAMLMTWGFLGFSLAGAGAAIVAAIVSERYRLLVGESVALSVAIFVAVGIAVAGGAHAFFSGLVGSWADMVSATQPADLTAQLRVVPFALCWFGALVASELIRRTRSPSLPIIGPLITLSLAVLLSAEDRSVALVQGTLLATSALAIGTVQQRVARRATQVPAAALLNDQPLAKHRYGRREIVNAGRVVVMLALVAVIAPIVGPRLPLANARDRYDLRNQDTPPWDPLAVPSPLVELKASLGDKRKDAVVFRVQSSSKIDRWQTAVLGAYDGIVWTVGSGSGSPASEFRPVDTRLPQPAGDETNRPKVSAMVTVVDLAEPWLPTPGWTTALKVRGGPPSPVRANLRTGTLAIATGLPAGLTYDISAYEQPVLSDDVLSKAVIQSVDVTGELDGLPPPMKNLAADLIQGKDIGWQQVMSVRDNFRTSGFYDSSPTAAPGHSYFRLAEFVSDPKRIVGYEEQYAAAAAVLMRTASLPVRVVVGYKIPDDRWVNEMADVRAGDISAWVEVHVDGHGWVAADVTPDRTRTPTTKQQGTVFQDVAVPNPPPPPQLPPNVQVITADANKDTPNKPNKPKPIGGAFASAPGRGVARIVVGAGGGLVAVFVLLGVAVVLAKAHRRRRRRASGPPAHRVAGAWLELSDRCRDAGVPLEPQTTPLEAARTYLRTEPSAPAVRSELLALVATIDRAAYHAEPPVLEHADRAWHHCDSVVDALVSDRTLQRRLLMRVDPRTLRHRDPVAVKENR